MLTLGRLATTRTALWYPPPMWKDLISSYCADATFFPGVSHPALIQAAADLGVRLPADLIALLLESNGIHGEYGLGLVWPIDRIVEDNLAFRSSESFRELYMPFDSLLFFGDAGNGDQFAFAIRGGRVSPRDVYAWDHENDSRRWVAPGLARYLEWWLTGRIVL